MSPKRNPGDAYRLVMEAVVDVALKATPLKRAKLCRAAAECSGDEHEQAALLRIASNLEAAETTIWEAEVELKRFRDQLAAHQGKGGTH